MNTPVPSLTGVRVAAWVAALAMWLTLNCAAAQQSGTLNDADNARYIAFQKLVLLRKLAIDSPVANRISQGADANAQARLAEAKRLYELSRSLLDSGHHREAAEHADTALKEMAAAVRVERKDQPSAAELTDRYRSVRAGISSFMEILTDLRASGSASPDTVSAYNLIESQVINALDRSHGLVGTDPEQTLGILLPVSRLVEETIVNARNAQTIIYSMEFESPEDEYRYELQRNESYEKLISRLASEGQLSSGTDTIFFAVLNRNEEYRTESAQLAAGGRFDEAMTLLAESTEHMMTSLRMAGLNLR